MPADRDETILAALDSFATRTVELLASMTTLITEQDGRLDKLEEDVASLGVRLETLHLLRTNRERELEQHIAAVDERVSTVHTHALRSLNLRTGGDTPA